MGCCRETDRGLAGHKSMLAARKTWSQQMLRCAVQTLQGVCSCRAGTAPESEAGEPSKQICQPGERKTRDASWERDSSKLEKKMDFTMTGGEKNISI